MIIVPQKELIERFIHYIKRRTASPFRQSSAYFILKLALITIFHAENP